MKTKLMLVLSSLVLSASASALEICKVGQEVTFSQTATTISMKNISVGTSAFITKIEKDMTGRSFYVAIKTAEADATAVKNPQGEILSCQAKAKLVGHTLPVTSFNDGFLKECTFFAK